MTRRDLVRTALAALLAAAAGPAAAQPPWFDPTQLPSFTGTVERYLANPRGEIDRLLFREGPQIVFPPDIAEGLRRAAPPGRPVVVWGIRARNAPVITMLAYAPNAETSPVMVDRLYWRWGGEAAHDTAQPMQAAGVVKAPYFTPQGDVGGAILEDGTVVLLPPGRAEAFKELLRPGARLAADGVGSTAGEARALLATQLGDGPQTLKPVVPPPDPPQGAPGQGAAASPAPAAPQPAQAGGGR